jgi:hypothetical protein
LIVQRADVDGFSVDAGNARLGVTLLARDAREIALASGADVVHAPGLHHTQQRPNAPVRGVIDPTPE